MIVDHGLELVLLHVPKCAGTSLRRAFLEDAKAGGRAVSYTHLTLPTNREV